MPRSARVFAKIPAKPLHLGMGVAYGKGAYGRIRPAFVHTMLYQEIIFFTFYHFSKLISNWGGYGVAPKYKYLQKWEEIKVQRRFLATLLAICMALSILPTGVLAADSSNLAEPEVTKLTVTYDGGEPIELLGAQPTVSMPAGSKPVFSVTFDDASLVDMVFVTSTKDGETKYLEAKPSGGKYVTDGYFDPNDTNYIPGTISVTFSKKMVEVTENNTVNGIVLSDLKTQLEDQGISISQVEQSDAGETTAEIALGEYFDGVSDVFVNASVSELISSSGIDSDEVKKWSGIYTDLTSYALKGENGQDYTLYFANKDWSDANSYVMLLRDVSNNKYIKTALNAAGLKDLAHQLTNADKVIKPYLDYVAISAEMDDLREQVKAHPTMTSSQKAEANDKIDDLERDKQLFTMGLTFIPMFLSTAGVATPLMITALLAGYSSVSDYFWQHRIGMIQGCNPIDGVFSQGSDHGGSWRVLTNESLKENNWAIRKSGNYYLGEDVSLIIISTMYNEPNLPIDVTICLHGHNVRDGIVTGSNTSCTWRLYDCKYRENQDGTVSGGKICGHVSEAVGNGERGTLRIDNCIIDGEVYNSGTITIAGGMFTDSVENNGTMNITGGTIINSRPHSRPHSGCIFNAGGASGGGSGVATLNISGGTILNTADDDDCVCIDNSSDGTVNITGGTIQNDVTGICINNYGTATIDGGLFISKDKYGWNRAAIENSGSAKVNIKNGTIYGALSNGGTAEAEITGGTIDGIENFGEITIHGGTLFGVYNRGNMKITGGNINANANDIFAYGIVNGRDGVLQVSGGTISGETGISTSGTATISGNTIIKSSYTGIDVSGGTLTISGCKINSQGFGITNSSNNGTVILCIQSDSLIEIVGLIGSSVFQVQAAPSYTGGVTYYSAPDAQGNKMTIKEASNINYSQPSFVVVDYVRLVAAGTLPIRVQTLITNHDGTTIDFDSPTGLLENGAQVIAAQYKNGKMTTATMSAIPPEAKSVKFPVKIDRDKGWTLFFLAPTTLKPLCEQIVLK